jgi:hypothetical protein
MSPSQGFYLHKEQQKYKIKAHNKDIHDLSGIWTHDSSGRAGEDSSCLRPLGYRDRLASERAKTAHALDRAATVIGILRITRTKNGRIPDLRVFSGHTDTNSNRNRPAVDLIHGNLQPKNKL